MKGLGRSKFCEIGTEPSCRMQRGSPPPAQNEWLLNKANIAKK
jgi:hypothetical protein